LASLVKAPVTPRQRTSSTMLAENGRIALLPEIGAQFQVLKNAQAGAADAEIASAFELSDRPGENELVGLLEKKFGRKLNPRSPWTRR
jgi:F-type H+-transporting ATPase subunit delta